MCVCVLLRVCVCSGVVLLDAARSIARCPCVASATSACVYVCLVRVGGAEVDSRVCVWGGCHRVMAVCFRHARAGRWSDCASVACVVGGLCRVRSCILERLVVWV